MHRRTLFATPLLWLPAVPARAAAGRANAEAGRANAEAGRINAEDGRVNAEDGRVNAEAGVAVHGTDVVAYATEGRPRPGRPEFQHAWRGANWRFASARHRDAFAADPARHAPAYGGFCAYAVSEGYTAPIDPEAWRMVDGRLFLNFSSRVQRRWERDMARRIVRADANWPRLQGG